MSTPHQYFRAFSESDRRLIRFQSSESSGSTDDRDILEVMNAAEGGKLDEDPEKALETHTEKLQKKIEAIPRGLYDSLPVWCARWLTSKLTAPVRVPLNVLHTAAKAVPVLGGLLIDIENTMAAGANAVGVTMPTWSYEAKFEQAVEAEAHRRLESGGLKLDEARRWLRVRKEEAENQILLLHAKKLVLEDLAALQAYQDRESIAREGESGALATLLGSSDTALSREVINDKAYFARVYGDMQKKIDADIASFGKLPDEFEAVQIAQARICADLRDAKVKPAEIEKAFQFLQKTGNKEYVDLLITRHIAKDKQPDLLYWVDKMSRIPGFQLALGLTSEKADFAPPMERVGTLFNRPPIKPVLFQLDGQRIVASYECTRLGMLVFRRSDYNAKGHAGYIIIKNTGRVGYRSSDGTRHRTQIGEGNNTLQFNFSDEQAFPPNTP